MTGPAAAHAWQRNVWALAGIVFTAFVGFQFLTPFLPIYVQELGVTDPRRVAIWSGLLLAVTPGLAGLLGPLWGRLADRLGHKAMMIRSLAGFVVVIGGMGFVTSVPQLFAARALQGLFGGFSVAAMALASTSCPRDKMPTAIARVQSAQLLSVAVGPAAGGWVASRFGIRYACLVTAALCAVSLLGLLFLFEEVRAGEGGVARTATPLRLRELFAFPHFSLVLALLLIAQFIDRGLSLLIPLQVSALPGVARVAEAAGTIIAVAAACATISSTAAARVALRRPIGRVLVATCVLGGVPCALMPWAGTWWSLLLLRSLVALTLGGALTLAYSLGGRIVPSEQRGVAFGWLALAVQVGTAASPLVTGGLAAWSLAGAFVVDAALAWLAAALLLVGARELLSGGRSVSP